MAERLVVCFRPARAMEPDEFARIAGEVCKRADALGARVIASSCNTLAFDFALDSLEDAVELCTGEAFPDGFGAALAQSELVPILESGSRVTLAAGRALSLAQRLAGAARAGEVLIERQLGALHSGELLTRGRRFARAGGKRFYGFRLDARCPLRASIGDSASHLVEPQLLNEEAVRDLVKRLEPGKLCVISADPGSGGSRALAELKARARLPALLIGPGQAGEPLGALRVALALADLENPRRGKLPDALHGALAQLLKGAGASIDAGAALVASAVGAGGLVLIDDATEIDSDSLEVVACAIERSTLRAVTRIRISDLLPTPLAAITRGAEPLWPTLDEEQQVELACTFADGQWSRKLLVRFCARTDRQPLSVREALAESLETGEWLWTAEGVVPRREERAPGQHSAALWIRRRLALLNPRRRALLAALAVLGGTASGAELGAVLGESELAPRELDTELGLLARRHWLERDAAGVRLTTRTARRVILEAMPAPERQSWHRAASRALEAGARPLALAAAALHAMLAEDQSRAVTLAKQAVQGARAAGLEQTADALAHFAASGERTALARRGLSGGWSWDSGRSQPSHKPPELERTRPKRPPAQAAPARATALAAPSPTAERRADLSAFEATRSDSEPAWSHNATQALKDGNWEAVQKILAEQREHGERSLALDRVEAMAELVRGETGAALRLLRRAKERAATGSLSTRSRSALALGVALASAGRFNDALLEALEALARARENEDAAGERACARFLAQLSARAGSPTAAAIWAAAAELQP